MPRMSRDEILRRLRGEKPQEEVELEEQVTALETPQFSQQEQDVAGILGTALGSIGAAGFRGLGDEARAKSFQQEAQKAGGLFAEREAKRQALREKLQEKVGAKRKQRLEEGMAAAKEDRAGRAEERADIKLGMAEKAEGRKAQEFAEQRQPVADEVAKSLNQKLKGLGVDVDVSKMNRQDFNDFLKTLPADKKAQAATSFSMPPTRTLIDSHIAQQKRAGNPAFVNVQTAEDYINKTVRETGREPVIADIAQERYSFAPATGTQEQLRKKGTQVTAEADVKLESAKKTRQELKDLATQTGDEFLGRLDAPIATFGTEAFGADAPYRSPQEVKQAEALRELRAKTNVSNITEFVRENLGSQVTEGERESLRGFLMDVNRAASVKDMQAAIDNMFDHIEKLQAKKKAEGTLLMGGTPQQQAPAPALNYESMSDAELDAEIRKALGGQ